MSISEADIHTFDNGVQIFDAQITPQQRERYARCNVHEEDEEELFLEAVERIGENGVFASVGTALGYYPLLAKRKQPDLRVICFEPLPRFRGYIEDNLRLNGLSPENVEIHPVGVSSEKGTAKIRDCGFGTSLDQRAGGSPLLRKVKDLIRPLIGKRAIGAAFEIRTILLSDIGKVAGVDHLNLVQMDIQGLEGPVLMQFFALPEDERITVDQFLVGTHGPEVHARCRELLEAAGYGIVVDQPKSESQPDGILYARLT